MSRAPTKETIFDEVFDSQSCFRTLLDSMSRPGTVYHLHRVDYTALPDGLFPHTLTILKTLCDNLVTFGVAPLRSELAVPWERYLNVNTAAGARPVNEADHVVFDGERSGEAFRRLRVGDTESPEHGATAIVQVGGIVVAGDTEERRPRILVTAAGPGVEREIATAFFGLAEEYLAARNEACEEYPVGIDLILVNETGSIASYPRSSILTWRRDR